MGWTNSKRRRSIIHLAFATGLLSTATSLWAQVDGTAAQAPASSSTSYDAAFFAIYSPANALEMVRRVPGFSLESSDEDVRGFGQAAGNVVINGQRPSAKSESLETILSRIPASRVSRIEILPGERFGSDFTGKAQVANFIVTGSGVSGTVEAKLRREYAGGLLPAGSASALIQRGASTFNIAAKLENDHSIEEGSDRIVSRVTGQETEFRRKVNTIRSPEGTFSASWAYQGGKDRTAHLNASYERDHFDLDQTNAVRPASGILREDTLIERNRARSFEIGGDVTRPLAGGAIKLVGLITRRKRNNGERAENRLVSGTLLGGFSQDVIDKSAESVARLNWTHPKLFGFALEFGGEGALNRLDSDVRFSSITATGALLPIDLPIDRAVVEEYRGEAYVNAGRSLSSRLRLDLGLTYEASRLTVTGDANARRTLRFLKPKATLDWSLPGKAGWRAQLSVKRTVAQLEFEDFISQAELGADRVNGGNADLVPERAWEALLTVQRKVLGDGQLKIELGHDRISLLQDRVLVIGSNGDRFDAPGNIGNGKRNIARLTLDAPIDRFGIKGGRINLYASYVDTTVRDPYTGLNRPFNFNNDFYGTASFRQDLGKFAWGFTIEGGGASTGYRRDELDRFQGPRPFVSAFGEYRPTKRTTIGLELDNLADLPATRLRTFFAPDRSNPVPTSSEFRSRNVHILPRLTIKHSFG